MIASVISFCLDSLIRLTVVFDSGEHLSIVIVGIEGERLVGSLHLPTGAPLSLRLREHIVLKD